jgi:hypothetical protein
MVMDRNKKPTIEITTFKIPVRDNVSSTLRLKDLSSQKTSLT